MAERKADRHPDIHNAYHVPVDEQKSKRFPHQKPVAVLLSDAHAEYHVYQKDIPSHLAGRSQGEKEIHWINNFGLKHIQKGEFAAEVPEYSILLEHVEGAKYVYFDGSEIRPLATERHAADPSKVKAALRLGDPPIGWVS